MGGSGSDPSVCLVQSRRVHQPFQGASSQNPSGRASARTSVVPAGGVAPRDAAGRPRAARSVAEPVVSGLAATTRPEPSTASFQVWVLPSWGQPAARDVPWRPVRARLIRVRESTAAAGCSPCAGSTGGGTVGRAGAVGGDGAAVELAPVELAPVDGATVEPASLELAWIGLVCGGVACGRLACEGRVAVGRVCEEGALTGLATEA